MGLPSPVKLDVLCILMDNFIVCGSLSQLICWKCCRSGSCSPPDSCTRRVYIRTSSSHKAETYFRWELGRGWKVFHDSGTGEVQGTIKVRRVTGAQDAIIKGDWHDLRPGAGWPRMMVSLNRWLACDWLH